MKTLNLLILSLIFTGCLVDLGPRPTLDPKYMDGGVTETDAGTIDAGQE